MDEEHVPISFLALVLISLCACNSKSGNDPGWSADALQMPAKYEKSFAPGTPAARLVASYCSQCHAEPSPKAHSYSDWVPVFRRMILLMEKSSQRQGMRGMMMGRGRKMPMGMMGSRVPTQEEQVEMLRYLQQNALKSIFRRQPSDGGKPGCRRICQILFPLPCAS